MHLSLIAAICRSYCQQQQQLTPTIESNKCLIWQIVVGKSNVGRLTQVIMSSGFHMTNLLSGEWVRSISLHWVAARDALSPYINIYYSSARLC